MMDLLTYARKAMEEDLISNLRGTVEPYRLPYAFHGVDNPDDYSLEEWNDAIGYILNHKMECKIKSRDELYALLNIRNK